MVFLLMRQRETKEKEEKSVALRKRNKPKQTKKKFACDFSRCFLLFSFWSANSDVASWILVFVDFDFTVKK
jgi:hypothetical protein